MTFHFLAMLLLLCASFCLRSHSFEAADVGRLHPVFAQKVGEIIHPRDVGFPFFIDEHRKALNRDGFVIVIPERTRQEGDITYRHSRFNIEALSLAAQDLKESSEKQSTAFDGAFNVVNSAFLLLPDSKQTIGGFSYTVIYQCLAIHTPYATLQFPKRDERVTQLKHFELVNALFVLIDNSSRSFAYVEIDENTGRPVFCGNTLTRASHTLQKNFTSPYKTFNDVHEPMEVSCSMDQSLSLCRHTYDNFGRFGGIGVRTNRLSQRKAIDWSQQAINASEVGTPALFLTGISLPTITTFTQTCSTACITAELVTNRQLAEDNPGPITRGTAIGLILVPAALSLVLTILDVFLITSTTVIKHEWRTWIIGILAVLDIALVALAIVAAASELPKMNEPLIYSSWYTVGNSALGEPVNVSSPIGDLQVEMLLFGEALSAQRSSGDAKNVTVAGLVISCFNIVILIAPFAYKCAKGRKG